MGTHGGGADLAARGITVTQRMPAVFGAVGSFNGFSLLCRCPWGKHWELTSILMQNNHATKTFVTHLQLIAPNWIGSIAGPDLAVFQNMVLKPRQWLNLRLTLGLTGGASLWSYQAEDVTSAQLQGIVMTISGTETNG